jgi:uncharacterized protein YdaU (DUF1376 family)
MPLRDQPYLPLYVQDFLTDEKLMECSASATGIYIRLLCIMHKSEPYGTILLKQKDKQSSNFCLNFACKLAKFLPYKIDEISAGIEELVAEGVLNIENDKLIQKRMVRDNEISEVRSKAGKKGGKKTQSFAKAKVEAKYDIEYANEIDIESIWNKWKEYKRKEFNFKYKSAVSEDAAKKELLTLCRGEPELAIKIIEQSIANGWKGLFKLKDDERNKKNNGATSEEILRAVHKHFPIEGFPE